MIYITGDIHRYIDLEKLEADKFPQQENLTKDDYLIVCGDFGALWTGDEKDKHFIDIHEKKNYTTLFVDGNHENFNLLNQYEESSWKGGKVHFLSNSVIHLMRGQVFTIDGLKFFTMGGGTSIDKEFRHPGKSWWPEEQPSDTEITVAMMNLYDNDWKVDYVISHTTSISNMEKMCYMKEHSKLNVLFDMLQENLDYRHWYFGHFHEDMELDAKHTAVYNDVLALNMN
jgi:hypothetical protein